MTINRPRQRVIALISDPDVRALWQPRLIRHELLSGHANAVGATSRLVYDVGSIQLELTETIMQSRLPDAFTARYEARGVTNVVENRFSEPGPGQTQWVMTSRVTWGGFMSMMGPFLGDYLRKQAHDSMLSLKRLAEDERSNA